MSSSTSNVIKVTTLPFRHERPGPPTRLAATKIMSRGVTLSWVAPTTAGAPPVQYVLSYRRHVTAA